jgi:hypothetical protein
MCLYFPRGLALIVLCVALLLAVSIVAINADWLIFPVLDNQGGERLARPAGHDLVLGRYN